MFYEIFTYSNNDDDGDNDDDDKNLYSAFSM